MLERFLAFLQSLGQAAVSVQERRAQVRVEMYAGPWEAITDEIPAVG